MRDVKITARVTHHAGRPCVSFSLEGHEGASFFETWPTEIEIEHYRAGDERSLVMLGTRHLTEKLRRLLDPETYL